MAKRKTRPTSRSWFLSRLLLGVSLVAVVGAAAWLFVVARPRGTAGTAAPSPAASGTAVAAGVQALDPSVDLGRVPLNTTVKHAFRLQNVGAAPATLGRARIEVLEGC